VREPDTPFDEQARIRALQRLNLLDSPSEERFDRYTRLAQKVFGVSSVAISLVDQDRQWFKSKQGIAVDETPRDISFCGHAILRDEPLVVPNALEDPRFVDNPLVTGSPHIRFYAGAPLVTPQGLRLGALCILDQRARELNADDRVTLQDLASMVVDEMHANVDGLTQLADLRGLQTASEHILALSKRHGWPTTLLMLDLDGFKSINDRFGHVEGNNALVAFSKTLRRVFRASDVVARVGGDEFCVLLPHSTVHEAEVCLSRLRRAVVRADEACARFDLRYSVGTAEYDADRHPSIQALMSDADKDMYTTKRKKAATVWNNGRNRPRFVWPSGAPTRGH
jgi:diguanylate cyclase (GGDEF)-like protein